MGNRSVRVRLYEQVGTLAQSRVDAEAGIIFGAKILGLTSSNRRRYTPEAIRNAAPRYERTSLRLDHPSDPDDQRSSESVMGWVENVRFDPESGLYGDLHLLKSHPMTSRVLEAAERNPRLFGLSHNADGDTEEVSGGTILVHEITEVRSVDLVADPATTAGLFESVNRKRTKHMPAKTTYGQWFNNIPLLPPQKRVVRRLFEMNYMAEDEEMSLPPAEETPAGDGSSPDVPPVDDPSAMDPAAALKAGFRSAMVGVLDDMTMDVGAKIKRLGLLLKTAEKLTAEGQEIPEGDDEPDGDEPEKKPEDDLLLAEGEDCDKADDAEKLTEMHDEPDGDEKKDKPVNESRDQKLARLERENESLRDSLAIRDLCEESGVKPSGTLMEALVSLKTAEKRRSLLEEYRRGASKPRNTGGGSGDPRQPKEDPETFARSLLN